MKKLLLLIGIIVCLYSGQLFGKSRDISVDNRSVFVAINPGAALSFVNAGFIVNSILPTALFGQEAGIAAGVGYLFEDSFAEARLCVGNSNAFYLLLQSQLSLNWFFGESFGLTERGPYLGGAIRYWDLIQVHGKTQSHNVIPLINIGWWIDIGRFFIDVRISQVFAIASWSNIPHAKGGLAWIFSPLPGISPWLPIGMVQLGFRL